jgi:hypothetical protein
VVVGQGSGGWKENEGLKEDEFTNSRLLGINARGLVVLFGAHDTI